MVRKAFAIAALVAAALPAPALAQGNYHVRNDTRTALSCALRREHGTIMDRFALRAGREWSQAARGSGPRVLLCDAAGGIPGRFRLSSGIRYALVDGPRSGTLALRLADPPTR